MSCSITLTSVTRRSSRALPNEPCWIAPEGVIHLNARIVAASNEPHILSSPELLESACARPKNLWAYDRDADVADLATSLTFGIAKNHPFAQGNKRTAFFAMVGFLGANSFQLNLEDDVACADSIIAVIDGRETEERFATILRHVINRVDPKRWG